MAKLIIDGREIDADPSLTLLQACEMAGAEIPRFCYHERLSIAGNCRMCLVEWVGAPKPQASCALQVRDIPPNRDGTPARINTTSPLARKAREGVMEFLLINHPLDCPICDQGGECDLQDQAMGYGLDSSRYKEEKRAVKDKYMGPLRKTDSVDVLDATGTNIRIDARSGEVLRILPRTNDDVNEEWMADRGRFAFDGLKRRRLDRPWVKVDGKLKPATWAEAFGAISAKLKGLPGERIGAVVGDLTDAE